MKEAADKLSAAGFEVKEFIPTDFNEIRKVTRELFTLDALSYPRGQLEKAGEPVVPSVAKIGFWDIPRKTHEEAWAFNAKKGAIQKDMLDRWQKAGIDIVLAPVGPHTAVLPGDWTNDMYTVAWNAVDVSKRRVDARAIVLSRKTDLVPFWSVPGRDHSFRDSRSQAGSQRFGVCPYA
jgi:amidase